MPGIYFGTQGGIRSQINFFQKFSATPPHSFVINSSHHSGLRISTKGAQVPFSPGPRQKRLKAAFDLVPGAGFEPARPCGHKILSLARLPTSPPGQVTCFSK